MYLYLFLSIYTTCDCMICKFEVAIVLSLSLSLFFSLPFYYFLVWKIGDEIMGDIEHSKYPAIIFTKICRKC